MSLMKHLKRKKQIMIQLKQTSTSNKYVGEGNDVTRLFAIKGNNEKSHLQSLIFQSNRLKGKSDF